MHITHVLCFQSGGGGGVKAKAEAQEEEVVEANCMEIHQKGKVAIVTKPFFCKDGIGTTPYFFCIVITIGNTTNCAIGHLLLNHPLIPRSMTMVPRTPEQFLNKVSGVAVKIGGKWGCVFILGKKQW